MERWGPRLAVAAAVAFGLVALAPDFLVPSPQAGDRVLHEAVTSYAGSVAGIRRVDFWWPALTCGYPLFAHYQHLAHLVSAGLGAASGTDAGRVLETLSWLLLAFTPAGIFLAFRGFGLAAGAAAVGAAIFPVLRTRPYFGLGWESYVSNGSGLTTQLWAGALLFPTLGLGYLALRRGGSRRIAGAGLLLALTALAHLMFGYLATLSLALLLLLPDSEARWTLRARRLGGIALWSAAASAYFVVPLVLHSDQVLRSQWELDWKWDSIGLTNVLRDLLTGKVLDGNSWPVLSACAAVGLALAVRRAIRDQDVLSRWLLLALTLWILLFAGRPTWGRLIDLLPMASGLHLHRFLAGVQAFAFVLAALGLDAVRRRAGRPLVGALVVALVLVQPTLSRLAFVARNDVQQGARRQALAADADFLAMVSDLRALPPGRVYAGLHYDWGKEFRIGGIPVYTHLQAAGFEMIGFPFMAMAYPAEWQIRQDWRRPEILDLFGVRYVVAPDGLLPPDGTEVRRHGRYVLHERAGAGWFGLGRVEPPPGDLQGRPWPEVYQVGRAWIEGTGPGLRTYQAWGPGPPPLPEGAGQGILLRQETGPNLYRALVELAVPGDLILKVTAHPGWRATVDGETVPIIRIFPGFQSVRVPAGRHEVTFRYRPIAFKGELFGWSMALFLFGGLTAGGILPRRGGRT